MAIEEGLQIALARIREANDLVDETSAFLRSLGELLRDHFVVERFAREGLLSTALSIVASRAAITRQKRMAMVVIYAMVVSCEVRSKRFFPLLIDKKSRVRKGVIKLAR